MTVKDLGRDRASLCSASSLDLAVERAMDDQLTSPSGHQDRGQVTLDSVSPLTDATKDNQDFDGTTVLCQVCGDKASGFHYGVHSCEGCKGFFRRSIQQKIQYKPCTKNQNCSILRINRNRCQYCRLKKCIAVGMSRDAVRFGRVPKREKAKILAAMQSVNQKYQERALLTELEDEGRLVRTVVQAHLDTCDFTWDKVSPLLQAARLQPNYAPGNAGMACPMSPRVVGADGQLCDSQLFGPHIKSVVEFAKQLPGFMRLPEEDRITLLKSSVFEVLLVWLACMFDNKTCTAACLNGQLVRRDGFPAGSQPRFLLDSMFSFAEQLNALRLGDAELGLFCACVVLTTERPGLRNTELIARIHHKLEKALRGVIAQNHAQQGAGLYEQLKRKVHDLKTLNSLHSDMIRALKEPIQVAAASAGVVSAAAAGCFWPSELVRRRGEANSPQSSLSSGYVGSEEGSVRSPSAGGIMDCSPSPPNDGPTPPAPVASSHPHLVAALQPRPGLQLLLPALAHLKTERPASCPSASPSPPAHPPQHPPQPAFVIQQLHQQQQQHLQDSGNGMVKTESEDYMPLLKQALSKPSLQSVVGGPGGGSGSVEGAGPGGVVRGILDQAFVPHKKFRWMRCRDNNVDVDGDVDVNSEDEKMPVTSSPPCSAGSQTPTLSRILGAPPQRSWSTEEQRRREAVAHLLSLQAGGPLVFRAADPRSPSPPSVVGGHHVPVVPAPMPPHAGRRVSPAPLCIVPPPAHSRSPTPASTPPPPSAQPTELQPLNLSKKVASQVQQPRITLEAS